MDNFNDYPLFQFNLSDHYLNEVQQLLRHGEDPNHQLDGGFSTLHVASMSNVHNTEVMKALINGGADVNLSNHLDFTPLHFAVYNRNLCAMDVLIQFGANVNAKTYSGRTPLHFAVTRCNFLPILRISHGHPVVCVIETLLDHEDIDCNAMDCERDTPLMKAIKDRQARASELLLYKGANPNISNELSLTPLHVALVHDYIMIISQLLSNGASIYAEDKNGQSPMDILIRKFESDNLFARFIKLIVFKYRISADLKRKVECLPLLSQYFTKWCEEVDRMRDDFICGNITVHDFVCGCFNDAHISGTNLIWHIYNPIMERLVADIYPEYLPEILNCLPRTALLRILKLIVYSRNNLNRDTNSYDIVLFSNVIIVHSIARFLREMDIFSFIVALSNRNIPETMENLHQRHNSFVVMYNTYHRIY